MPEETEARLLTASWVVPGEGPALHGGRVGVEGDRVSWVGRPGDAGAPRGRLVDLGPGVLLPGLVNAHCHLELSHLRGRLDGAAGFVPWVRALVDVRGGEGDDEVRAAAAAAIRDLVATGTVAVGDVSNELAHLDLLRGSRLSAMVFYELLAWDPTRAEGVLAAAAAGVAGRSEGKGRVAVRLAAHGPHSVSPALLRGLVREGGPAALHLAESAAEARFLATGEGEWREFLAERGLGHVEFAPPGLSPVAYAESLGVLHPGLVAAHCVQTGPSDWALLARRGVHVAVCPRSNRRLGVGIARVPEMLAAGVRLCLGTDSLASVDSLDLVEDMAALRREFPALDARAIVAMATAGGAAALGLGDLGTIAPGRRAALAFAPAAKDPEDPFAYVVSGGARLRPVDLP